MKTSRFSFSRLFGRTAKNACRGACGCATRGRSLQLESLEKRELLAIVVDDGDLGYSETGLDWASGGLAGAY